MKNCFMVRDGKGYVLMLFSRFPRVRLENFPTPLEHMSRFGASVGHDQVYIKRDDVMTLGMGGNKVRNLEFWMGEALRQGADVVLAAGMTQSNQCRLTAAAAAKLGLPCVIVHNENEPEFYQGNLLLNHLLGAELVFLGPINEELRAMKVQALAEKLQAEGKHPYVIGDEALGALGYANAALELHQQAEQQGIDLRHVVIVGAMAVTATGFLYGTALLGHPFHVHVISVEYSLEHLQQLIEGIYAKIVRLTKIEPSLPLNQVMTLYETYLGPGYAKPTDASLEMVHQMAQLEGLFLENVYSSKTAWGLKELIVQGTIPASEAVCFIHTGGGPALFAQAGLYQRQK